MTKKKCSNSIVWHPLFPLDGWFGFTTSVDVLNKELKRKGANTETFESGVIAKCLHIVSQDYTVLSIVCYDRDSAVSRGVLPIQEAALLAHEAVHATKHVYDFFGIDSNDHELFAISVQGFTQFMLEELRKLDAPVV